MDKLSCVHNYPKHLAISINIRFRSLIISQSSLFLERACLSFMISWCVKVSSIAGKISKIPDEDVVDPPYKQTE